MGLSLLKHYPNSQDALHSSYTTNSVSQLFSLCGEWIKSVMIECPNSFTVKEKEEKVGERCGKS